MAENEEISRQNTPQRETRPQAEKERMPDYHQRKQEREPNGSTWSGASGGGGVWAGRLRHEERERQR